MAIRLLIILPALIPRQVDNPNLAFFDQYVLFCELVEKDKDTSDFSPHSSYEYHSNNDLLGLVDEKALGMMNLIKSVLADVQAGMAQSAIDGTLDSDVNAIDMLQLFELGRTVTSRAL